MGLIKATIRFLHDVLYIISFLRIKREDFQKMEYFVPGDAEDAFNFILEEFFGVFKPQQKKSEFLELLKIFEKRNPHNIMEIGTYRGGTLFCFCKLALNARKIISVDLPPLAYDRYFRRFFKYFARRGQKLHLLKADSHKKETLEKIKEILDGELLDFLFIGADHSYESVKMDFEMYSPLVKPGGIIALHDIHLPGAGVEKFWNEIKKKLEILV